MEREIFNGPHVPSAARVKPPRPWALLFLAAGAVLFGVVWYALDLVCIYVGVTLPGVVIMGGIAGSYWILARRGVRQSLLATAGGTVCGLVITAVAGVVPIGPWVYWTSLLFCVGLMFGILSGDRLTGFYRAVLAATVAIATGVTAYYVAGRVGLDVPWVGTRTGEEAVTLAAGITPLVHFALSQRANGTVTAPAKRAGGEGRGGGS